MAPSDDPRYLMYIVTKEPQQNTENIAKDMSDMFITVMQQALQMRIIKWLSVQTNK